ncbi:MAG TPA: exonuclease domain-containing protein [Solirubrobacteraceae bacterium]|nr:exonuclease domain-containing protein [Solirubrobacteraceae bacterium]
MSFWRGWRAHSESARAYARARQPSPRTPWREASYCVVDLELSGLDPRRGEIVSFGALPIEDGRVRLEGATAGLVRPTRPLAEESIRVHGIRAADLADAPVLADALGPLLAAMTGRVLIAHHAPIERVFLSRALRRLGVRLHGPVLDTALLARIWLAERDGELPRRMSLTDMTLACGLPVHSPHTAIGDALTTAQLFVVAVSQLDALRPETLRRLARAQARLADIEAYLPARPERVPPRG